MTSAEALPASPAEEAQSGRRLLFVGCFVALVATSFAFIIRVMCMGQWQDAFGLTETEKGQIFGAGMWPFGLSIVLFSLIIDRIGYGKAMIFAFLCHVLSTILLVVADGYWLFGKLGISHEPLQEWVAANGYWWLYWGSILNGLAAGTVEAVINPVVATMYPKKKTTMLTVLHAGWPGGFVLGGLLILGVLPAFGYEGWHLRVATILIPTVLYGLLLMRRHFPVHERVAAGVSYRDMLREAGAIGWLIVVYLVCMEVNNIITSYATGGSAALVDKMDPSHYFIGNLWETTFFDLPSLAMTILMGILLLAYLIYTRSLGRPMYIFLLLIMILLAITELGTDTWIGELMGPSMAKLGEVIRGKPIDAGWVLVYTATIMMVLRFCIAPIEKLLRPLGVLLVSAIFAAIGLRYLARVEGGWILVMATIYGTGQCFFWPVTLGLVAERFPRGGALTLNAIAGVGMLGVGIFGSQLLGYWQDTSHNQQLQDDAKVYDKLMAEEEKQSIFGTYRALDQSKVNEIENKADLYKYRQKAAEKMEGTPAFDEVTAALAHDPSYQTFVRKAYNQSIREPGEEAEKSFDEMHKALRQEGFFAQEDTFKQQIEPLKETLDEVRAEAKRDAMGNVAYLPMIMGACYLLLIIYFKAKGGYKVVELAAEGEAPTVEQAPASVEERREKEEEGPTA